MAKPNQNGKFYSISAVVILCSCLCLFCLDKDTRTFTDLLKPGNIFALLIYVIPTYIICILIYHLFQKLGFKNSFTFALCIGIFIGFTSVIISLSLLMGRI